MSNEKDFQGDALQSQGPRSTALTGADAQATAAGQAPSIAIAAKAEAEPLHAVWEGITDIGGFKLRTYVLNNGERVFDATDAENFLRTQGMM